MALRCADRGAHLAELCAELLRQYRGTAPPFHAVNASLSVSLLLGAALLFTVNASSVRGMLSLKRARWFYLSQALMFAYFAIDDRFKIHESVGDLIGIGDHFVLIAAALVEFLFLARLGGIALLYGPGRYGLLATDGLLRS